MVKHTYSENFEDKCFVLSQKLEKALNKNKVDVILASLAYVIAKISIDVSNQDKDYAIAFINAICHGAEHAVMEDLTTDE